MAYVYVIMSNNFILLFTFVLTMSACNKPKDPTLEKYFGTWKFTKTENYWSYNYDQNGNSFETEYETIQWERIGEVSMGTQVGELEINWSNSSSSTYFAKVKNSQGHLSCASGCQNIPYAESGQPQYGQHHITETEYRLDLGNQDLSSIQKSWDIKGVKQ